MAALSPTLFNRSVSRRRSVWLTVAFCLILFTLPFAAAALDHGLAEIIGRPALRPLLLPPVIISYILLVAPFMARGEAAMLRSLRPSVLVDDETFAAIVAEGSRINPRGELAAAAVGAAIGFAFSLGWDLGEAIWLRVYLHLALPAMFAMLAWTIYDSLVSTRLMAELCRQPLAIDLLDISPFESIGRQSLLSALVFLGGIVLGVIFGLDLAEIMTWRTFLAYGPLALMVVLLFFLSMRDSHHVLTEAKQRELALVRERLAEVTRRFRRDLAGEVSAPSAAADMGALLAYERRIRGAPTWPYNPSMLQTLMFSILLPIMVKAISWFLFDR